MYNARAQAAIEFLTTYAWAILAILILIGALMYFDILSPSKFLPDRCNLGAEISCKEYVIKEDGLRLKLFNNVGSTIIVDEVNILNDGTPITCSPTTGQTWYSGEAIELAVQCAGFVDIGLVANEKRKLGFEIIYHTPKGGTQYKKYVQGEIFATVQEGSLTPPPLPPVEVVLLEEDFEAPLISTKWDLITTTFVTPNSDCGAISPTQSLEFTGGTPGTDVRQAQTVALDISQGARISFQIKGPDDDTQILGTCTSPDAGEDLVLEYLPLSGTWTTLVIYIANPTPPGTYATFQQIIIEDVDIPPGAKTTGTKFRWRQVAYDSASGYDNWAIDDVRISTFS